MIQFVLANFNKSDMIKADQSALLFETCLRQIHIFTEEKFEELGKDKFSKAKVLKNLEAIEYLIKVISGLESPILGETEVLGQFKKQILPQLDSKPEFKEVIDFVLSITKFVRTKHLKSLGSQTYGSMVRRVLKGEQNVLFVGSGVLAKSILPWVYDSKLCMFSVRNTEKFNESEIFEKYNKLTSFSLSEKLNYDFPLSVIVCAPVESSVLQKHLESVNVKTIIDLREESENDPLKLPQTKVYQLKEVFSEISQKKSKRDLILQTVNKDIKNKIDSDLVKHRPFGWDDLCVL